MLVEEKEFIDKVLEKIDRISVEKIKDIIYAIEDENKLLKCVADSLPEGLLVVDKDNFLVFANSFGKMFLRNLKGELFSSVRFDELEEALKSLNFFEEKLVRLADSRVLKLVKKQLPDSMTLYIIGDITDEFSKDFYEKQQKSISALSTLVAGIAHEVKNPLSSILIHLDILEKLLDREDSRDKIKKTLNVLRNELNRLNSIINDFLFSVKPFRKKDDYIDVNEIVKDVVELMKAKGEKHGVEFEVFLDNVPKIIADRELIKQAILNIVKNAVESMEDKGGKVIISTYFDRGYVAVKVSDTGKGIPVEDLPRIFEPYYTTKPMGTGLGLTNVYRIVKEYSGYIEFESQEGKGTTFTLLFPLYPGRVKYLPSD